MKNCFYSLIVACLLLLSSPAFAQVQPLHTVILILENHSYNQIVGSPDAPYINSVFNDTHTARFTQSYALTHPSQPNYLMLFSGSAQGVVDDGLPNTLPFTAPNLGASLLQAGYSFIGYSEDLPSTGYNGEVYGAYARKHNPWVNWQDGSINGIPANDNKPLTDFPSNFNNLPALSIVVPNLNHDIHDGSIAACDAWVQSTLSGYIEWCKNNNSLFVLTFDEDDYSGDNKIVTFFTGANIKGGNYDQRITHYNVLRTLEELYQLPYAGASADSSAIKNIWLSVLPVQSLQFNATPLLNTTLLKWETSEEHNTKEFQIERSTVNGQNWLVLATIMAAGNSNNLRRYSYTDASPVEGKNLYRIKQVDQDNHAVYSRTLAVEIGKYSLHFKVYPNPATNNLSILSTQKEKEPINIQLTDILGRRMLQQFSYVQAGMPAFIDLKKLRPGTYFVQISNGVERVNETVLVK